MRVLFLQIIFAHPDHHSNLYTDLVLEFLSRGHEVYVATLLEKRQGTTTYVEDVRGAKVLHVACGNMFSVGVVDKARTLLSLPGRFMSAIGQHFANTKFDLVLYPTPPITFAPVVARLKREQACHSYLILRDIFPQNARDLGMIRDPFTFWFFRRAERRLYQVSDFIGCMSQGNIDYVLKHNDVPREKLEILYNWEKPPIEQRTGDAAAIRARHGLTGKFVAVFGGNIGFAQELDFLIELAAVYRDRSNVVFLIIGKGVAAAKIARLICERGLSNVVMKDFVPREEYNALLSACDIGLINLDRRFTIPNIPSKTLSYFAAGIPVLASIDAYTDYGKLLDECDAGLWSVTGDLKSYQANFEKLLNDPAMCRRLGENGRRALQERFSVQIAYETIMRHFA